MSSAAKKASVGGHIFNTAHKGVLKFVRATLQIGLVEINTQRCKGCGICVAACPAGTLKLSESVNIKGYNFSEQATPRLCIGCATCALLCPDGCISVFRKGYIPHNKLQ